MLLVRRSLLIIFFSLIILSLIGTAAWAYVIMTSASPINPGELRYRAETLLFTTIVAASILTAALILIIVRSRNIDRMLDRLIRQNNMNPASTREGLLRLGKTGGKLNILYRQIDDVSEKRGLKISAMSNAIDLLSENLANPMLMIDISGRIIHAGRNWPSSPEAPAADLRGSNIEELFSGISITDIVSKLEKTHLPVKTASKGISFNWIMISDRKKTPGYLIVTPASD